MGDSTSIGSRTVMKRNRQHAVVCCHFLINEQQQQSQSSMAFLVVALFASALIPMNEAYYYFLYKDPKKWMEAMYACSPGQLATWSSDAEWNRIVALHKESGSHLGTWVGLSDGNLWYEGR